MSPFLMNVCACVVVIFINNALQHTGGDLAIGAYGIVNRTLMLFVMIVMGITQGMQPIVGYNYGAKQYDRVRKTLRYGITAGVVVTTVGFVLSELFPHAIVAMFTTSEELVDLSVTGLRISCAMFPFVGCQIVISNFFQSIGRAPVSIFLSLSRQLLFLLPLLLILPTYWSTNGVWLSMPISDFIAFVIAVMALWIHQRKSDKNFKLFNLKKNKAMKKRLTIALVAHDNRKADMVEWVKHNAELLSHHHLVCTGTTGRLIKEAFDELNIPADVTCMNSGPLGGDAEIAALVVRHQVDLAIFLIDDLNPQPHEADIQMLLRQCRVHNVPIACNRYSADLMITSTLWDDDSYKPTEPKYTYFQR